MSRIASSSTRAQRAPRRSSPPCELVARLEQRAAGAGSCRRGRRGTAGGCEASERRWWRSSARSGGRRRDGSDDCSAAAGARVPPGAGEALQFPPPRRRAGRRTRHPAGGTLASSEALITFSKTVGESDVYLFAGHHRRPLAGPRRPRVHEAQLAVRRAHRPRRAGARLHLDRLDHRWRSGWSRAVGWKSMVSLGYDGIRFVAPVRIGDTITVRYRLHGRDDGEAAARRRSSRSSTSAARRCWSAGTS